MKGFKFKGGMTMKKNNTTPEDEFLVTPPRAAYVKKQLPEFIHVFGYLNMHSSIDNHIELYEKWFSKDYLRCFSFFVVENEEVVCLNFGDDLTWISSEVELFKALT